VGEDPDSVISPGHDPTNELVNAIRAKNVPRVIAILNRHDMNLDLERSYEEGLTPLMIAFKESRSEPIIQSLLEHRAKIYAEDENGRTVLHRAAASGDVEMVRLALAKNAGKEARDKNRLTPMLVTVSENHPKARECVQALLDAGDDMLARDKYDWTVVHFAAHNACRPERSNAPNAPVHALKLLRFLIERGAPVDAPAKNGDTALCLSAGMGHAPTVVVLLNVNAHVNHLNRRGRSPLYLAVNEKSVTKEHEAVVRALLDHNAIVDESILPPKWKDFKHLMRSSRSSPLDTLPPDVTAFRNVNRVNSTSTVATTASSGSTISRILGGIRRSNGS
jgi:ankyrin repeat protein